MLNLPAYKMVK